MLPYGHQSIDESDIEAVAATLRGDWLTTGPALAEFEAELGRLSGGRSAVACSSGTAALHTAYAAAGVGPGDEVITTPMTFIATASAATLLGAKVVFADVDPTNGLINPASVAERLTERTRVVAAVDFGGNPADYVALTEVARSVGALTLADAAHSFGGRRGGQPVGALADLTTLSFFPTKNLTTAEGGAVLALDAQLAQRAREFRGIGLVRDPERFELDEGPWHQEVHELGVNYRLSDVAATLGLSQLRRLSAFKQRRQQIFRRYGEALAGCPDLATPSAAPDSDPMWHLYPVRVLGGRRREVYDRMRGAGIGVQVNYLPVYWHPVYTRLGYPRGLCPEAERFYAEELSLPMYVDLADAEVDLVCDTLRGILA